MLKMLELKGLSHEINLAFDDPYGLFWFVFLASNWSAGFGTFLLVLALWLEDCANFMPTPKETNQCSANYS
jgi:hypothetical protein